MASAENASQAQAKPPKKSMASIALALVVALIVGAGALSVWVQFVEPSALEERLQGLVDGGYPAALGSITTPDGAITNLAAGVGNLESGSVAPVDGEIRIGSNTKMYVAAIVLQLVEEGLIDLDESVDTYLPGLIPSEGTNRSTITVRHLLQHTSGLQEYVNEYLTDVFEVRNNYVAVEEILDGVLELPREFPPGQRWGYSNTNYLILGLLIEQITDQSLSGQLQERIIEPLGLQRTYLPRAGELQLRGEHPRLYHIDDTLDLRDITDLDPSFAGAAGAMVASPSELNRFMLALLNGEIVSGPSLREMQDSVDMEIWYLPGATYGLGLLSFPLTCGGTAWGHSGELPGTLTWNAVGPNGTAATIAVTAVPWAITDSWDEKSLLKYDQMVRDVLNQTLCDQ